MWKASSLTLPPSTLLEALAHPCERTGHICTRKYFPLTGLCRDTSLRGIAMPSWLAYRTETI